MRLQAQHAAMHRAALEEAQHAILAGEYGTAIARAQSVIGEGGYTDEILRDALFFRAIAMVEKAMQAGDDDFNSIEQRSLLERAFEEPDSDPNTDHCMYLDPN